MNDSAISRLDVPLKIMNTAQTGLKQLFKDKKVRLQALIALLVLTVGFVLSIAGFVELQAVAKERLYLQTQQRTAAQIKQIQTNIDISLDSLIDIAALHSVSGDVTQSQLASYISSDTKYHSGTVALGWVPKVRGGDIADFEAAMRKKNPDFYIYEVTGHGMPTPAGNNRAVFPIKAIISLNNSSMRAGLNLASIASRKRVMNKAERKQSTAITQRISLYAGSRRFDGFQAFHPVFSKNKLDQDEITGFVVGNYDIQALIEDVFSEERRQIDIALYDANTSNQQLLYTSTTLLDSVDAVREQQGENWTYALNVAEQQWIVVVFPRLNMLDTVTWLPYSGLIVGALITLLFTLYLFIALIKTRQLAQMSTDLAGTETQLDLQTKLKQEADKANRAKSGLLTAASHDLRQPLHTISLLTTLLKDSKTKTERTKLIDNILTAADNMNTMFISLLDISLLESNQLPIHKKHFYLQDILDKLTVDFSLQAKEKGLKFSTVETSYCVMTDPILLERILRNLLSNAFRYTPKGKVLLGCRRLKNHVRVMVLDTGIGLSPEAQSNMFETFYRDKKAKQLSDQGLGLGLAIVQQAANLLGLDIGIESHLAKGTAFCIDVPYGAPILIGEELIVEKQSVIDKLVWIIEDDEAIRFGLRKVLESWQCRVESLASGEDVHDLLEQGSQRPDILIADYQLINETGLDLLIAIREHYQYVTPAVVVTGTSDLSIRRKIEKEECAFMMKPVKPDDLNHILHQLIQKD